jgi:hypothetical protein
VTEVFERRLLASPILCGEAKSDQSHTDTASGTGKSCSSSSTTHTACYPHCCPSFDSTASDTRLTSHLSACRSALAYTQIPSLSTFSSPWSNIQKPFNYDAGHKVIGLGVAAAAAASAGDCSGHHPRPGTERIAVDISNDHGSFATYSKRCSRPTDHRNHTQHHRRMAVRCNTYVRDLWGRIREAPAMLLQ